LTRGIGTFKPVLKPFNDLFFGLEVLNTEVKGKTVVSTNLWFWQQLEGWNYVNFPYEVTKVGHVVKDGRIYLGILSKNKIAWGLFLNNWALGLQQLHEFTKYEVDSLDFCPIDVKSGFSNATTAYVISSCDDDVELFSFKVGDVDPDEQQENPPIPTVEFTSSRTLFKNRKNIQLCVLKNEIIIYGTSDNPDEPRLQSYDIQDSTRSYNIETKRFKINDIRKFVCKSRLNQFLILNYRKSQSVGEIDSTEVYAFVGGM
jgi:hypothetical protein